MMNDYDILATLQDRAASKEGGYLFQGTHVHPNPRHFKYRWDVAILSDDRSYLIWYRDLSTAAFKRWELNTVRPRCAERQESYFIRNRSLPRWSDHPLRAGSDKYGHSWALPYDVDPDPVGIDAHK